MLKVLVALASAAVVAAHGGVLSYGIAGKWYQGWFPYNSPTGQTGIERPWSTYNPITDATDTTLSCNDNGQPGALQESATIAAGTPITAYWNVPWPHTIGPIFTYMGKCPSTCTSLDTNSAGAIWFKIAQGGLESGTLSQGHWAMADLITNNNSWTVTIPATLPPGEYLIRHELIAIHTSNQPQWYPECGQLIVTGTGTNAPTSEYLVAFPGAYSMSNPNIDIDIYSNALLPVTNYTMPGPPLWSG